MMVNDLVVVHPFASVMVHVNVPAHKEAAVAPVPPEGAHEYEYGAVPPEATTVALPLHTLLQVKFTCDPVVVKAGGCVIVKELVVVQPFASVMVHV